MVVLSKAEKIVFWDMWMNATIKSSLCKGRSLLCYVINLPCFNILVSLCRSCLMQCEPENLEYRHFRLSPTGSVGGALLPPYESHCTNTRLSVTRQIHNVTSTQIQTHRSTNTLTALSLCKLLLRL